MKSIRLKYVLATMIVPLWLSGCASPQNTPVDPNQAVTAFIALDRKNNQIVGISTYDNLEVNQSDLISKMEYEEFINFVDQHLVENPNTPEGKLELLKFYYSDNLPKLQQIKTQYDKAELFEFGMSIPPSN